MGFFDGLKRDTKQTQAVEEVETPQIQEQEEAVESFRETDPEDIEVIVRETDTYEVVDMPTEPLKTYKDKAPVKHVIGHTKIIAIINQKGGVGKSTTAINLGAALGEMGKQVLLVDLDPQGNCSSGLGVEKSLIQQCIYDVLLNDVPIENVIIPDIAEGLDIAPATINLAGAEVELVSEMARENRLKEAVGCMRGKYDFILIDCPPSLGLLTVNALVAADKLLIPIQCEFYALEGVTKLLESMKRVKSRLNPTLDIYGILLTMYDSRTTLSKQVVDEVREYFGRLVFSTPIPRTVKLSEAPSFGQPITQYDPKGRGSLSYIELAKEVIARG
ncbi:AAA family ATPase [Adlercreutzia sp. R25]|uniref:AAA family ATPase n=1 Tax=Adlercreutzia shanghongiae TaxID=3111773 RepID=A0ABU6IVG6_9ACTN|nr:MULTISPECIES: AAA family ATPase [unclassified Adlercreutzia]MEC4272054.1 AAA family ATPase [Adlercreutzia sp. R25]MEC4293785.1 AAA family ATPase [Adlercreutzia sp. R22]